MDLDSARVREDVVAPSEHVIHTTGRNTAGTWVRQHDQLVGDLVAAERLGEIVEVGVRLES
jgi:hypothetical protein